MEKFKNASTGSKGIDEIISSLRYGDNVVWQTDSVENYKKMVDLFVNESLKNGKDIIYIRFAEHHELVPEKKGVKKYLLDARTGFEKFTLDVHYIIEKEGIGAFYVFDCLSELLDHWATDLMIGNFFCVTCPYLFELDTIAYFSILQNSHSHATVARIRETTQLLLDLNCVDDRTYIHPLKVWNRYSPTMFLPHVRQGEKMVPVTNSDETARLFGRIPALRIGNEKARLDYWDKLFLTAKETPDEKGNMFERILKLIAGFDEKILALARKHLTLDDLLMIKARSIGSGSIGGKALGMLLARKIVEEDDPDYWGEKIEAHDSFYVGSDVFYSYIVQNNMWKIYLEQKKKEGYLKSARILREKLQKGIFPDEIKENLTQLLEYFGQSPIIVRSSSLLEDGFGNSFSGKYESFFLANQGNPIERYHQLENAIKQIYSSTMSEDALMYRKIRGLDERDEQMAILIQRVSGDYHGRYFFPLLAGVGFSRNTHVWKPEMDVESGMIRLVMGLGTRAVNRTDGDYPRIMALDHPKVQPVHGEEDTRKYTQHNVDLIDLEKNCLETVSLNRLMWEKPDIDMELLGVLDHETNEKIKLYGIKEQEAWILNYEKLINSTDFIDRMKKLLKTLERSYGYPVDTEFTVNFIKDGSYRINILQCRPLQTKGFIKRFEIPSISDKNAVFFEVKGNFMGGNISKQIKRVIYVEPKGYSELNESRKYAAARLVGKLTRMTGESKDISLMLMGPGRWGTTTASLGIPITFFEISNVSVLCEIAFEIGGMTPDLSYGSHFFQDLVEEDIFYTAIFPNDKDVLFNSQYLLSKKNLLLDMIPEAGQFENVVKIFDVKGLMIVSDIISQRVLCYDPC